MLLSFRVFATDRFSLITCPGPGLGVTQVIVFKLSGLEDPGAEHHLTLSPARQGEEVRGDRKPHSQDNGRSVELAEIL